MRFKVDLRPSLLSLGKADASIAFLSLNRSLRQSSNEFNFVDFAYARHRSSKLGVLSLNRKGGSALAAPGVQNSKLSFQWLSLFQELGCARLPSRLTYCLPRTRLGIVHASMTLRSLLSRFGHSKASFQWLSLLQELKRSYELLLP